MVRARARGDRITGLPRRSSKSDSLGDQRTQIRVEGKRGRELVEGLGAVAGQAPVAGQVIVQERLDPDARAGRGRASRSPGQADLCVCSTSPGPGRPVNRWASERRRLRAASGPRDSVSDAKRFALEEAWPRIACSASPAGSRESGEPASRKVEHQIAFGLVELLSDLVEPDPTHLRAVSQEGRLSGGVLSVGGLAEFTPAHLGRGKTRRAAMRPTRSDASSGFASPDR